MERSGRKRRGSSLGGTEDFRKREEGSQEEQQRRVSHATSLVPNAWPVKAGPVPPRGSSENVAEALREVRARPIVACNGRAHPDVAAR